MPDFTDIRCRLGIGTLPRWLFSAIWIVWLPFGIPPLADLLQSHDSPLRIAAGICGAAVFVAVYVWAAFDNSVSRGAPPPAGRPISVRAWWPVAVMAALAVVFVVAFGPGWFGLFIYAAASVGPRFQTARGAWIVAGLTLLLAVLGVSEHEVAGATALGCLLVGGIGMSVVLMAQSVRTVHELSLARAEVARLAVAEERLRFSRDLHDLLGHSLSLIALKCDLAKQLMTDAPERARGEIEDAESVARDALHQVREAVAGYRQTSLAGEVAGGREVLAAAGIGLSYEGVPTALPPATEAVLAWTVREAITNVIRHSRARHCAIRLLRDEHRVGIEITDDGDARDSEPAPPAVGSNGRGSGLAGLAERAAVLGGRCEAGPRAGGGFRLAVWLPIEPDANAEELDRGAPVGGRP